MHRACEFGPFTLDTETRQLLRDGSELHLSPKAFELLWSLVEHRPRVCDKSELLTRIWPDTYVVDANLNVLIGEIRKVLEDSAKQPRFIRTVHGVGYAFCGTAADAKDRGKDEARPAPARQTPAGCSPRKARSGWRTARTLSAAIPSARCGWTPTASPAGTPASSSRAPTGACGSRTWRARTARGLGGVRVRARVEVTDGDELAFGEVKVKLRSWSAAIGAETKRIPRLRR